jgi:uncharacterized ferritin-like protein (DUF455 family)
MHTLREWRTQAENRGYARIAELVDYLQADELTHVKLAANWIRRLTENDPARRDELASWGRSAVDRITSFFGPPAGDQARFTFMKPGDEEGDAVLVGAASNRIIGE